MKVRDHIDVKLRVHDHINGPLVSRCERAHVVDYDHQGLSVLGFLAVLDIDGHDLGGDAVCFDAGDTGPRLGREGDLDRCAIDQLALEHDVELGLARVSQELVYHHVVRVVVVVEPLGTFEGGIVTAIGTGAGAAWLDSG